MPTSGGLLHIRIVQRNLAFINRRRRTHRSSGCDDFTTAWFTSRRRIIRRFSRLLLIVAGRKFIVSWRARFLFMRFMLRSVVRRTFMHTSSVWYINVRMMHGFLCTTFTDSTCFFSCLVILKTHSCVKAIALNQISLSFTQCYFHEKQITTSFVFSLRMLPSSSRYYHNVHASLQTR